MTREQKTETGGYHSSLLDQLSNLALNSLLVETCCSFSCQHCLCLSIDNSKIQSHTLQTRTLLLAKLYAANLSVICPFYKLLQRTIPTVSCPDFWLSIESLADEDGRVRVCLFHGRVLGGEEGAVIGESVLERVWFAH
jgi:hypothetical protein